MYCSKCGAEVSETSRFCSACGARFVERNAAQETTQSQSYSDSKPLCDSFIKKDSDHTQKNETVDDSSIRKMTKVRTFGSCLKSFLMITIVVILYVFLKCTFWGLFEHFAARQTFKFIYGDGAESFKSTTSQLETITPLDKMAKEEALNLPDGWTRIEVPNLFTIDIPPTLELQKGKYKEYKKERCKILKIPYLKTQGLIIQQAGLNELCPTSFSQYARIMVYDVRDGDYTVRESDLSSSMLSFLDEMEHEKTKAELSMPTAPGVTTKLLKWYPVQKTQLGGFLGWRFHYIRQLSNNPPVLVETYKIRGRDSLHCFVFSYRMKDEGIWDKEFQKVKNRIQFAK